MSFLNALASDGLTVGLRYYTAKMNNRAAMSQQSAAAADAEALARAEAPADGLLSQLAAESQAPAKTYHNPPPQTPEEMAKGRAEAKAMLAGEASLGQLQAVDGQAAASEALSANGAPGKTAEELEKEKEEESDNAIPGPNKELTDEEKNEVEELKRRDQEVRTHEQAHRSAGGGLTTSPSYTYQAGPDGQRYAIGGEVGISTSGSSDPEVALREAETVKKAATAPANPSSQDHQVAASAAAEISELKAEISSERAEEVQEQLADKEPEAAQNGESEAGLLAASAASELGGPKATIIDNVGEQSQVSKAFKLGSSSSYKTTYNGTSFSQQVMGAYAAMKGAPGGSLAYRPVSATV